MNIEYFGINSINRLLSKLKEKYVAKNDIKIFLNKYGYYYINDYKTNETYPLKDGKIFAGWYTDESLDAPYYESEGVAYAKFVDADVLTAHALFYTGEQSNKIDFISSTDSHVNYKEIGFEVDVEFNERIIHKTCTCTKVYESTTSNGTTYTVSDFFSNPDSTYLFAYLLSGLPKSDITIRVDPYWITKDGTKVLGSEKTFIIENEELIDPQELITEQTEDTNTNQSFVEITD